MSRSEPHSDRYDDALAVFVPVNEPEHIRNMRKRLLTARDWASLTLSNPHRYSPGSLNIARVIVDLTTETAYSYLDTARFDIAVTACNRLYQAITLLNRLGGQSGEIVGN